MNAATVPSETIDYAVQPEGNATVGIPRPFQIPGRRTSSTVMTPSSSWEASGQQETIFTWPSLKK